MGWEGQKRNRTRLERGAVRGAVVEDMRPSTKQLEVIAAKPGEGQGSVSHDPGLKSFAGLQQNVNQSEEEFVFLWGESVYILPKWGRRERKMWKRCSSSIYGLATPSGRSCMQQEKGGKKNEKLKWVSCLDWNATSIHEEPLHQKQLWSEQCFQMPPWCPPGTLLWTSNVGFMHQCPSTEGLGWWKTTGPRWEIILSQERMSPYLTLKAEALPL